MVKDIKHEKCTRKTFAKIGDFVHKNDVLAFLNLLCKDDPNINELTMCSLETRVDEKSSPACIIHTSSDETVSVENALVLADAYRKAMKKFEMHIFYDAPHGIALGNDITSLGKQLYDQPSLASWIDQSILWTKQV